MHYLSVENLSKTYADKPLFKDISFHINEGDKLALVAKNGAGKSTLLKILTQEEIADEGTCWIHKEVKVVYLGQDPNLNPNLSIIDNVFTHDHPIVNAIKQYELLVEQAEPDPVALGEAIKQIDELNGWSFDASVKQILGKLNIHKLNQPVQTLSGGQKKRIALAKILIDMDFEHRHSLLILDEPTNHLDIQMIEWLEHYLSKSTVTLLLVTHDRYFLDAVCNGILELENQTMYRVNGNYERYIEQKALREENEQASIEKAKNRYRKELEWMRKQPKARTTKSKSRQEAFYEWKEKALKNTQQQALELSMKMSRLGGKVVELKKVYKAYGDKVILNGFDYTFNKGERVGIIGENGVGKSTFVNIILGLEDLDSGKLNVGDTVVFGNFSQQGLEIKEDVRVIEFVKNIAEFFPLADGTKLSAALFLQKFLFTPEKQYTYISKLSGGEKKRLQLLAMLFRNPNFLILDEPTNDLDLPTLDILEEFLHDYPGCILIISHDRYFMDKIVDHLFVFEGKGEVTDYPGNYSQYRVYQKATEKEDDEVATVAKTEETEPIKAPPTPKKLSYKERREFESLEQELPKLQEQLQELTNAIQDANIAFDKLQTISEQIGNLQAEIDEKEMRWLELSELAG